MLPRPPWLITAIFLLIPACGGSSLGGTGASDTSIDSVDSSATTDSSPHDGGSGPDGTDGVAVPPSDVGDGAPLPDAPAGPSCGYGGKGQALHVADGIDVCLPPVVCTAETCPPALGKCVDGACTFQGSYAGLKTLPEAWATYYCTLSTGGCHGVTQLEFPEVTAATIAKAAGFPLCEGASGSGTCVGIAASSPMVVGNSQLAIDPATGKTVSNWGLGLTEASGLCYEIEGPGGKAIVALTDRCGGYCRCGGSGFQECGPCVSAPDMEPNCACVGGVPGLHDQCCGRGCVTTKADCDWCASNNHPHFDLDTGTFNHLCGADGINGSCRISKVRYVPCLGPSSAWPPGGGGGSCKIGSYDCPAGPEPHHPGVPGTKCCCNWDLTPQGDGSCK